MYAKNNDSEYFCINNADYKKNNICFFKQDFKFLLRVFIYFSLWSGGVILVGYLQNVRIGFISVEIFVIYIIGFVFIFFLIIALFAGSVESVLFPMGRIEGNKTEGGKSGLVLKLRTFPIWYKILSVIFMLSIVISGQKLSLTPLIITVLSIIAIFVYPALYVVIFYVMIKVKKIKVINKEMLFYLYGHYLLSSISSLFIFMLFFPLVISFNKEWYYYSFLLFVVFALYLVLIGNGGFFKFRDGDDECKFVYVNWFNFSSILFLIMWLPVVMPFDNKRNILSLVGLAENKGKVYEVATASGGFMLGEVLLKTSAGVIMCDKNRLKFISNAQIRYLTNSVLNSECYKCDLF